jgi:hypothetical protein
MTHEEIRARIAEIEPELFGPDAYLSTSILRPLDPAAQLAREERREALRREREGLLAQLPVTGERAGHMVIGCTLGTVIVRESEPEYRADPRDAHGDDPMWRYMKECGENWE